LAVSWADGQVGLYDGATGAARRTLATGVPSNAGFYRPVALSPNGAWLAAVGPNNTVQLHAVAEEQQPIGLGRHQRPVPGLAFRRDGRYLASASEDRPVGVWDVRTATEHLTLQGHDTAVGGVAFSPDGTLIATASDDQTLRLWDAHTGQA